jgi:predicted nucleotidyltransferase component of viral defense system
MIKDEEIEQKAAEFSLSPSDVEKDYIHGWVLKAISSRAALQRNFVLKGGSALRKGYLPNTRFSKDLDFSANTAVDKDELARELVEVRRIVESQTGVRFLDQMLIKDKGLPIPGVSALEARLYFKGFYNEESVVLKTQLDITEMDKIYLPVQSRGLIHPYSDAVSCAATIRCQKIEEILASKLTTLLHRRRAADLFDLLYATVFANEYQVARLEVITTFLKKSIFEPQPDSAKGELLAVPLEEFRESWSGGVLAPLRSLFDFGYVLQNFARMIETLFALLVPAVASASPFGRGGVAGSFRPSFGGLSFFGGSIRSAILGAGRNREMVELVYDGYRRVVEPYKLQYYVRKSDGVGSEYFWGYDTTGGKSGPGIKQFFCHKIQSIRATGQGFTPRFPMEL